MVLFDRTGRGRSDVSAWSAADVLVICCELDLRDVTGLAPASAQDDIAVLALGVTSRAGRNR